MDQRGSSPLRPVVWIAGARKEFVGLPQDVQLEFADAVMQAQLGRHAPGVRAMKGLGTGVMEVRVRHRGDAFRLVYWIGAVEAVCILHAFQKRSHKGRTTDKKTIELIRHRLMIAMAQERRS